MVGWCKIPMLTSAEGQDTNVAPVAGIIERIKEVAAAPGILDASIFMAQPWLDVPEHGWTVLVVAEGDPALASREAESIATDAWNARHLVLAPKLPIPDAVALASAAAYDPGLGPFVFADGADSVSAGCPGDGPALAAALAAASLPGPALAILTDEPAVRACERAGVGARLTLEVGATIAPGFHSPVALQVEVEALALGGTPRSTRRHRWISAASRSSVQVSSGSCSPRAAPVRLDYELYLNLGLDPRTAHVVAVKSAGGYRAFYEPIARECIDVAAEGPSDSRLDRLPFRNLGRPMFPFEPELEWTAAATVNGVGVDA